MPSVTADAAPAMRATFLSLPATSLKTLRWLSFGPPAVLLIAFDYLRHSVFPFALLHDWPGFVVIWAGTLVVAFVLSQLVFGAVGEIQAELLKRHQELSTLHKAASRQANQLRALHEASKALTSEISLEAVLQKVVDLSRELVGAQFGALAVYEDGGPGRLITSGLAEEDRGRIDVARTGLGIMASVPKGKPLRLLDIHEHPLFAGFPLHHPDMRTFLGVPLAMKGRTIGNLRLTNKAASQAFTQEDEDIVMMLASQAAIAICNAECYRRDQVMAILQERERIAQDLHDGIIQGLYAVGLGLEQCIEQADARQYTAERLATAVDKLNDIIREIRNYIFALERGFVNGNDLAAGLDRMVQELRINSLIDAELIVQGDVGGALGREQVDQLLHIVREALTNVLRHAKATFVTIQVRRLADQVELCVVDNGRGFDAHQPRRGGLGLRNIAERTRSLGGRFDIESAPRRGATLKVAIPVAGEGRG